MSCDGQCGKQGTQTRTRVCDNGNCANATYQSVEIRAGCIATATCTGLLFASYYDQSTNISLLISFIKNIRNYFR